LILTVFNCIILSKRKKRYCFYCFFNCTA
jgi:hypothetical protein